MAQKDSGDERPSLEMPSLGFGRSKKREKKRAARDEPAPEPEVPEQGPVASGWFDSVKEEPAPAAAPTPVAVVHDEPLTDPYAEDDDPEPETVGARKARRERRLPSVGGGVAAVVTGAVVGLVMVVLTWASLRLCEVVQGTSSCGNPGFLLLLAIMVLMVVLGGSLLRALGVADPMSTSFLGVGLVAVVSLLFLVDLLFNWWMVLVIPAASVASFALAHWVSTAFVEPSGHQMHR